MTNISYVSSSHDPAKVSTMAATPLPGIGRVAKFQPDEDVSKIIASDSTDARSRPFNLLRAQLIKRMSESGARLVGVASAAPGAGKSFVASNLAASISQLPNRSVYLVDLDLRRATQGSIFGVRNGTGMTEYLMDDAVRLEDVGLQMGDSGLILYPSFPAPVDSAALVGSNRFKSLIAAARALPQDSVVIFDLPPAFANDDAIIISQQLDGYLMVVEQGVTTKKQLHSTMQILRPATCFGTIFNRFNGGVGDPYGYSGKYDSYYSS
jgi:protein-tyrosine kinase